MADPLDILTLEGAISAINMDAGNAQHSTELLRQITAVSRMIDAACGPVVQRTIDEEMHDGSSALFLHHSPVIAITTVRVAEGSIVTLDPVEFGGTNAGYHVDLSTGRLERRSGAYPISWGGHVEVTYEAGRFADTESVDSRFAECAASILRRLWKREAGTWAQSADFFETLDPGAGGAQLGFFRVAKPIIDEMLADEKRPKALA